MISVAAVNAQDLDQNTLSRLKIILRIHHPLVAQFTKGDIDFNPEQIHKDPGAYDGHNACLSTNAFIKEVIPIPIQAVIIFLTPCHHRLQPAADSNAGNCVDTHDDIVHFCPQTLGEHIVQHILRKPATKIFRRFHGFLCRNNDLDIAMIYDCKRT